ncbi:aldose epimerase family protein [Mesorhizobium sp. CAU 1741]|uniref:aldose epimerase family protein n=1 Tax=Mesorhizobium sp. CAU 1741 TaxID=3140366 RepID=UPI00325AAC32
MTGDTFGHTRDGDPVHEMRIAGGRLSARILTYGAVVRDLRLAGHDSPLVLGFETLDHYLDHSLFFGAIVGRYANRITGGKFIIDGERYQADTNDNGNTLHGGSVGLHRRLWSLKEHGEDFVTLGISDLSGDMGFPGTLDISCTYRITPASALAVELTAQTDRATLCNLAHHSYFNLDDGGRGDILSHRMRIAAQAYLPVNERALPTGAVMPVEGTAFDFVLPRTIRHERDGFTDYDYNFCLASARQPMRQVAWVQGGRSGVEMEVWTTEPGLQLYAGQFPARTVPGLDGITYRSHAGLCLEPQIWPDAPNRPYFPQALLRPGEQYRQVSEYRFRAPEDI